jgi:cysteine synthase A
MCVPSSSDNYVETIGNTPLVRLRRLLGDKGPRVLAKVEGHNASGSIKARVARSMISQAQRDNTLRKGMSLIEPTSGNLGLALAMVAAAQGIDLTLILPHTVPACRLQMLERYGANLELTHGSRGMQGALFRARQIVAQEPDRWYMLNQFENPAIIEAHYESTGPEIWEQCRGDIDVLVCGVGTGGTISGVGKFLKEKKSVTLVAVEPSRSPILSQWKNGQKLRSAAHGIEGIGAGFLPPLLAVQLLDRIETVDEAEAIAAMKRLAREEGIVVGPSCGAATAVALKLAQSPEFAHKTIVVILPESGAFRNYLSA